jgi:hypothetical protein
LNNGKKPVFLGNDMLFYSSCKSLIFNIHTVTLLHYSIIYYVYPIITYTHVVVKNRAVSLLRQEFPGVKLKDNYFYETLIPQRTEAKKQRLHMSALQQNTEIFVDLPLWIGNL